MSERADLVEALCDGLHGDNSGDDVFEPLAQLDETALQKLDSLSFESGRCPYSRESLQRMLAIMRVERCDYHVARKKAFGVDDDWRPSPPSLDDPIEHPTVARVNALVRRYLHTAIAKWGLPERVVVEHVRSSFMGPQARAAFEYELRRSTADREKTKQELIIQGVARPGRRDLIRHEAVTRQNGLCLYCGDMVTLLNSELDHIIPRSGGGSNRRDNLVAVCKNCNQAKGKLPFVAFAAKSSRPTVTVELARERLRSWQLSGTRKQQDRFRRDVGTRLGLEEDADPVDDRSLESTAYAAREMRGRITAFLEAEAARQGLTTSPEVAVYPGGVTSESRKAGRIDKQLRLRGADTKSRFDRRHHAIDATVLTLLDPSIAKTLRERTQRRNDEQFTSPGTDEWKQFEGSAPASTERFRVWRNHMGDLADLVRAAVDDDQIAVVRPLRLSPRSGAAHKDTVEPLVSKQLTDEFTAAEIQRVVSNRLMVALAEEARELGLKDQSIPADDGRPGRLSWEQPAKVDLYPSSSAYVPVRGGAAKIGDTIQHARVYAWRKKDGFAFGMVRMYNSEIQKLGWAKRGVDIMTEPLPEWSMAMRTAPTALRDRIASGEARQIGWITVGDEFRVDLADSEDPASRLGQFLRHCPETRWRLVGFDSPGRLILAPLYLAYEGVADETPDEVSSFLKDNRYRPAANGILGQAEILRRTVTGRPRWTSGTLPSSWSPSAEAQKVFVD